MKDQIIKNEYAQLLGKLSNDEAFINQLDEFYTKYANEINGEFKTEIESMKASVLIKIGQYEEALQVLEKIPNSVERDGQAHFNIIYDLAFVNFKLGYKAKAMATVEEFLRRPYSREYFYNLNMLKLLVEIKEEEEISLQYSKIINSIREYLGIKESKPKKLNLQVKELAESNKKSNINYGKLLLKINSLAQNEQVEELQKFIANEEELPYYKKLAAENLKHRLP